MFGLHIVEKDAALGVVERAADLVQGVIEEGRPHLAAVDRHGHVDVLRLAGHVHDGGVEVHQAGEGERLPRMMQGRPRLERRQEVVVELDMTAMQIDAHALRLLRHARVAGQRLRVGAEGDLAAVVHAAKVLRLPVIGQQFQDARHVLQRIGKDVVAQSRFVKGDEERLVEIGAAAPPSQLDLEIAEANQRKGRSLLAILVGPEQVNHTLLARFRQRLVQFVVERHILGRDVDVHEAVVLGRLHRRP